MTTLVWDKVDERPYEAGIDRGVLYLPDNTGVAWNGLVSIDEEFSESPQALYMDGIKVFDRLLPDEFSAALKVITYPDEFMPFDGLLEVGQGLFVGEQRAQQFNLSYRTGKGRSGYQIHLVYNLTAVPEVRSRASLTGQNTPMDIGWKIKAVPENVPGYRPTAHAVIDSDEMHPDLLADLEEMLYGSDEGLYLLDGGDSSGTTTDVLDAGTSEESTGEVYDGGSAAASTGVVIDGNEVIVVEGTEIVDGGTSLFASTPTIDGGTSISSASAGVSPTLPPLAELVDFITNWALIRIVDNGDGTWSAIGPEELVYHDSADTFVVERANVTYLDADTFELSNTV